MPSELAKRIFSEATERRLANWKRSKCIRIMAEAKQAEAFHILFEELVRRYGKEGAVDSLISAMCDNEARIRELEEAKRARKKRKQR